MEHAGLPNTILVCGVPVLQWQGVLTPPAIASCQRILQSLARNGYREVVIDLQKVSIGAPRELQRLLSVLDKILPAHTLAEVVLPAGSSLTRQPKRLRLASSVTCALSHITRLPAVSLQAARVTQVRWTENQG